MELITFGDEEFLLLLALVPLLFLAAKRFRRPSALRFPDASALRDLPGSAARRFAFLPSLLRALALVAIVVALARPQAGKAETRVRSEGIDVVLAVDLSTSMYAEDFERDGARLNRLDALRPVILDFIEKRPSDRFAIVIFAGVAFTQCPLTLDREVLRRIVEELRIGSIEDGTAIGLGIATSLNRLRDSAAKTKLVVLLSDGSNNAGNVDPLEAGRMAKDLGMKVYTIGAGRRGIVPFPVLDPNGRPVTDARGRKRYRELESSVDEETLKAVAEVTGARYFRAEDSAALEATYAEIDRLEKTEIEAYQYTEYRELYPWAVAPALALLALEFLLRWTRFRGLP